MAEHNVIETLEMVDEAKTRDEKREILKSRDNYATRALLQLNFHPDVKWHIPKGSPPYTPSQEADSTEGQRWWTQSLDVEKRIDVCSVVRKSRS